MTKPAKKPDLLGRLKSFGLSSPWQAVLLLPAGWDDLTRPLEHFGHPVLPGDNYVVVGRLVGPPSIKFSGGAPRLTGYLSDCDRQFQDQHQATFFWVI